MTKAGSGQGSQDEREWYGSVIDEVTRSGELWAVWCGDSWATAEDPSNARSALFLLWRTQQEAEDALSHSRAKFPPGAIVDSIPLQKWVGPYTQDLAMHNDAPFLCRDRELRGVQVDPLAFQRDLMTSAAKPSLQASDLGMLKSSVKRKRGKSPPT